MSHLGVITNKRSGSPATTSVEHTSNVLCDIADELTALRSLRPGPGVDHLFARLVGTIVKAPADLGHKVLADPAIRARLPRFRSLSDAGERELELAWSARICASASPLAELNRFPYLDNYRRLVRLEVGVLTAALPLEELGGSVRSLAFIGCGPLPLSALFLARDLDTEVTGFDRDAALVDASRRVAAVTAVAGATVGRFHEADAAEVDLSGYEVVVLAALVGTTPVEKATILAKMRDSMTPGTILLARSARGLRSLLYPPVDETALSGFELLTVVHPVNDLVNSVIVARVAA